MVHSRLAMQKDFCSESPGSNFGDPGFADTPEFGLKLGITRFWQLAVPASVSEKLDVAEGSYQGPGC
jgi:hypothetical protein